MCLSVSKCAALPYQPSSTFKGFGEYKIFLCLQNWLFLSFQHKHRGCLNLFLELPEEAQTSSLCGPQYCLQISALPAMPFYHSTAKKLLIAQMGRTDEQNLLHPAVQTPRNKISSHILAHRRRAVRALKISRVSPGWEEV